MICKYESPRASSFICMSQIDLFLVSQNSLFSFVNPSRKTNMTDDNKTIYSVRLHMGHFVRFELWFHWDNKIDRDFNANRNFFRAFTCKKEMKLTFKLTKLHKFIEKMIVSKISHFYGTKKKMSLKCLETAKSGEKAVKKSKNLKKFEIFSQQIFYRKTKMSKKSSISLIRLFCMV